MAVQESLAALTWPVRTERLVLRTVTDADLEPMWQIRRRDDVNTWMTLTSEDLEDFRTRADDAWRARTLVIELDGRLVGDLMVRVEDAWAQGEVTDQAVGTQAEIGWCLDPALQGQGYATEAVRALLEISFVDLGLRRVIAQCFADNEPSWRLMERIGMRREAYFVAESLHRSGEWLDSMTYALLARDWQPPSTVGA